MYAQDKSRTYLKKQSLHPNSPDAGHLSPVQNIIIVFLSSEPLSPSRTTSDSCGLPERPENWFAGTLLLRCGLEYILSPGCVDEWGNYTRYMWCLCFLVCVICRICSHSREMRRKTVVQVPRAAAPSAIMTRRHETRLRMCHHLAQHPVLPIFDCLSSWRRFYSLGRHSERWSECDATCYILQICLFPKELPNERT